MSFVHAGHQLINMVVGTGPMAQYCILQSMLSNRLDSHTLGGCFSNSELRDADAHSWSSFPLTNPQDKRWGNLISSKSDNNPQKERNPHMGAFFFLGTTPSTSELKYWRFQSLPGPQATYVSPFWMKANGAHARELSSIPPFFLTKNVNISLSYSGQSLNSGYLSAQNDKTHQKRTYTFQNQGEQLRAPKMERCDPVLIPICTKRMAAAHV